MHPDGVRDRVIVTLCGCESPLAQRVEDRGSKQRVVFANEPRAGAVGRSRRVDRKHETNIAVDVRRLQGRGKAWRRGAAIGRGELVAPTTPPR
jgi:hypothetical protein